MELLWLPVGIALWFLIGYISTRLLNAGILGHDSVHGGKFCDCETEKEKGFYWGRPVTTEMGRTFFGAGCALGPITFILICVGFLMLLGSWLAPSKIHVSPENKTVK